MHRSTHNKVVKIMLKYNIWSKTGGCSKLKKKILDFIYEGCEIAIWMGLITMTYQLFTIIKSGSFGIQTNWSDVALLIGVYIIWFFAWSWDPKSKSKLCKSSIETQNSDEGKTIDDNGKMEIFAGVSDENEDTKTDNS